MGFCYNGEGVAKDLERAVEWYLKAASRVALRNILGVCYAKGEGVAKDLARRRVVAKAAEQNDATRK